MSGEINNAPLHYNSMRDMMFKGPGIKGKPKIRQVDGKQQLIMKTNDGNYYAANKETGGWDQIKKSGRKGFLGKTKFESVPQNPQEVAAQQEARAKSHQADVNEVAYLKAQASIRNEEKNG